MFWVVLGLGQTRLTALAGWLTLILSFTTCAVPGFLLLLGDWGQMPTWAVLVVIAATALALTPLTARSLRRPAPTGSEQAGSEQADTGVPVSVP